jgi:hypothetical protein
MEHGELQRWFIGAFITIFGLWMALQGHKLSTCSRFFYFELKDARLGERFAPVVVRRKELEGGYEWAWRLAGLSSMFFGALVLLRILQPEYASSTVFIANAVPASGASFAMNSVDITSRVIFLGFGIWAFLRYFRERMRTNATSA